MTPAEIAQTNRMLITARRNYVHYCTKARGYEQRGLDVPSNIRMSLTDEDRTIKRLEDELIAAGVQVEV
jgi:hypothetical protein